MLEHQIKKIFKNNIDFFAGIIKEVYRIDITQESNKIRFVVTMGSTVLTDKEVTLKCSCEK